MAMTTLKNNWFYEQNISSTREYHTFKYISFPLYSMPGDITYVRDEN